MTQRRVCIILGSLYPYSRGGVEVLFTSVFRAVVEQKQWEVVVLARKPRTPKCFAFSKPLPTVVLPSLRSGPIGKIFEFVYLSFLDQFYFDKRVSMLADNYLKSFDVVITPDPLLTLEICRKKVKPKIIQFVSGAWAETVARTQPLLYSVARRIEAEAYERADRVVFMDESYSSHFNVDEEHRVLIPNGVDLGVFTKSRFDRSRLRARFGMNGKTVIMTIGALRKRIKGHEFLLQAIPDVVEHDARSHFYLAGKGDQEWLRSISESLGITDNLHLLGERMDVPELLCASDIFLMPSLTEGTPGALLEAMAMELPCIATRVGNIPEVLRNRQEGLLINPGKPREIADAIAYILSNTDSAKSFGIQARNRIQANYDLAKTTRAYVTLIEDLCRQI